MKMMWLMMTITYFSEKRKKRKRKNREEIRVPEFGGWGRNKSFWPEYLLISDDQRFKICKR